MKEVITILVCTLFTISAEAQATGKSEHKMDTLIINRNDDRYFEAEYNLDSTLKFKEVSTILDSSKTISIKLTFNEGAGAMLYIHNPFSEQLVYKAELYSYKKKDYLETSTVPVFAKLSSFETWPYKIDQIQLTGFRLTKERE
jgi:hypothetical protein